MSLEQAVEGISEMIEHLLVCYVPTELCPDCQGAKSYLERLKAVRR